MQVVDGKLTSFSLRYVLALGNGSSDFVKKVDYLYIVSWLNYLTTGNPQRLANFRDHTGISFSNHPCTS
jgi:hypothetical protein